MCQEAVSAGQGRPLRRSAKIVNVVDTIPLGTFPTATGGIARLAYAYAQRVGFEPGPLLKKAGLSEQQIKDRDVRLSVRAQIQFLSLLARSLGDEFLGVRLAESPDLRELGMLFYVAASSLTLGDALQRAARYSSIANEGLSLKCLEGEHIRIVFEYVGITRHSDRHQIEFLMVMLIRLCRHLTDRRLTPTGARITHRRSKEWGTRLAALFGGNIAFGARTDELIFPGSIKGLMVSSADPYLNDLLVANCEQALAHRRSTRGAFRTAVENAIVPLLPHGLSAGAGNCRLGSV